MCIRDRRCAHCGCVPDKITDRVPYFTKLNTITNERFNKEVKLLVSPLLNIDFISYRHLIQSKTSIHVGKIISLVSVEYEARSTGIKVNYWLNEVCICNKTWYYFLSSVKQTITELLISKRTDGVGHAAFNNELTQSLYREGCVLLLFSDRFSYYSEVNRSHGS